MNLLDIGILSERSGLAPSALRHYEAVGLIKPVARRGLRRQYDSQALTQLSLIALGKSAGFSLEEIRDMFRDDGMPALPRLGLHARADAIDRQIKGLSTLRDALRHVADCPAEDHMSCPRFQRLMRLAGTAQKSRKHRAQ